MKVLLLLVILGVLGKEKGSVTGKDTRVKLGAADDQSRSPLGF
jgi:hypothetical protein